MDYRWVVGRIAGAILGRTWQRKAKKKSRTKPNYPSDVSEILAWRGMAWHVSPSIIGEDCSNGTTFEQTLSQFSVNQTVHFYIKSRGFSYKFRLVNSIIATLQLLPLYKPKDRRGAKTKTETRNCYNTT